MTYATLYIFIPLNRLFLFLIFILLKVSLLLYSFTVPSYCASVSLSHSLSLILLLFLSPFLPLAHCFTFYVELHFFLSTLATQLQAASCLSPLSCLASPSFPLYPLLFPSLSLSLSASCCLLPVSAIFNNFLLRILFTF